MDGGHECFMQSCKRPDDDDEPGKPEKYYFYDFETQQDTGTHIATYVDVAWTCTNCMDIPTDDPERKVKIDNCKICEVSETDRHKSECV